MIDFRAFELYFSEDNISGDAIGILTKILLESPFEYVVAIYRKKWRRYKFIGELSSGSKCFKNDLKKYLWKDSILIFEIPNDTYKKLMNYYIESVVDIKDSYMFYNEIFGTTKDKITLVSPLSRNSLIVHHDALSLFYLVSPKSN